MLRSCEQCGAPFEARRSTARFCSPACQKRAKRAEVKEPAPVARVEAGSIADAVRADLGELVNSTSGQTALMLAQRLDRSSPIDTGSAIASMAKALDAIMARLAARAPRETDPLEEIEDEVARKRETRSG